MSQHCPHCHASAGYGHSIGHKWDCPENPANKIQSSLDNAIRIAKSMVKEPIGNPNSARSAKRTIKYEELLLREMLWLTHKNHGSYLYGDDGEMQCSKCMIDFLRDPVNEINRKLSPTPKEISEALKNLEGNT